MRSKCPTGTGYRVSHLSHPPFFAETQGFQVSHLLSHVGQQHRDERDAWDKWDSGDRRDARDAGTARQRHSAVEGEREKRDDECHAGQCDYDLDDVGSIGRKFLTLGESL
jgi:hypothetical protein